MKNFDDLMRDNGFENYEYTKEGEEKEGEEEITEK